MASTHWKASITYEYEWDAPQTLRTTIAGGKAETAARRALAEARKAYPNARTRSIVLLLEKVGPVPDPIPTGPSGETVESSDLRA